MRTRFLQLGRDPDVSDKTAFVLAHKLRAALTAETAGHGLEVEIGRRLLPWHCAP